MAHFDVKSPEAAKLYLATQSSFTLRVEEREVRQTRMGGKLQDLMVSLDLC